MQLGNSQGNSINITAINITSSQIIGQVVAYPNKAISPEGSIIYSVNSACPTTSGSSYSVKVYVTYKEVSSPFQSLYFSSGTLSGTVAGAAGSSLPPGVITSSIISIINTQTTVVSGPFQQMVNLSLSSIKSYINNTGTHSFQNVEFFNRSNDAIIKSWLENYSFSKNWALYWIVLPNGISALTNMQDVAVGFASNNTDLFNKTNDGEAPQLSSTYGQYDDGANLFIKYQNFSGTSVPAGWTNTGGSLSANNGLIVTGVSGGNSQAYPSSQSPPSAYVEDLYGSVGGPINTGSDYVLGVLGFQSSIGSTNTGYVLQFGRISSAQLIDVEKYNIAHLSNTGISFSNNLNYTVTGLFLQAKLTAVFGYSTSATSTDATYTSGDYGIRTFNTNAKVIWWRLRAYPPNGVMPSALILRIS